MRAICGFLNYKVKPVVSSCGLINSFRNTYILKRRYDPFLSKLNAPRHKRLRGRHFVYDLVEDTNQKESPDVHVLLTSFVEGVGDIGDKISVMACYARDHLLLPGKAVYATPENIEYYSRMKKDRPEEPAYSSIYAGMTIRYLQSIVIPVQMNPENPWTIKPNHIRASFRKEGTVVPEYAIKLPEIPISGPDPSKEGRDFAVFLTMNGKETFPVRCRLFHFKAGIENLKLPDDCYQGKESPILDEQEELLNSMPVPQLDDGTQSFVSLKEKYRITLLK